MSTRRSPSKAAKEFATGTKKTGLDGNKWEVREYSTGLKRWVAASSTKGEKKKSVSPKKRSKSVKPEDREEYLNKKKSLLKEGEFEEENLNSLKPEIPFTPEMEKRLQELKSDKSKRGKFIYDSVLEDKHNMRSLSDINEWVKYSEKLYDDEEEQSVKQPKENSGGFFANVARVLIDIGKEVSQRKSSSAAPAQEEKHETSKSIIKKLSLGQQTSKSLKKINSRDLKFAIERLLKDFYNYSSVFAEESKIRKETFQELNKSKYNLEEDDENKSGLVSLLLGFQHLIRVEKEMGEISMMGYFTHISSINEKIRELLQDQTGREYSESITELVNAALARESPKDFKLLFSGILEAIYHVNPSKENKDAIDRVEEDADLIDFTGSSGGVISTAGNAAGGILNSAGNTVGSAGETIGSAVGTALGSTRNLLGSIGSVLFGSSKKEDEEEDDGFGGYGAHNHATERDEE